jgi:glycosyltransferase involved in cell wall biosynthesis
MIKIAIPYAFHDEDWLGGRNYFANLIRAIQLVASDRIELTLVTGRDTRTTLIDQFEDLKVLRTSLLDRKSAKWWLRTIDMRLFNADRLLAAFLRSNKIDVVTHCMHLGPRPGIITIAWLYDFQFLHLPELWTKKQLQWSTQWYKAACRNCDALVVSSASALEDLNKFSPLGSSLRRVLRFVSNPIPLDNLPSLKELQYIYPVQDKYFFLPNQFWQNKNHELVIESLAILKKTGRSGIQIVCTGNHVDHRQPYYFDQLMKRVSSLGLVDSFLVLGIVPLNHAQALMAHCLAVINPSRFEGWSTTVEEAKTMGKIVFLSQIPVHIEQNPPLGIFFDPNNAQQLADYLHQCYLGDFNNMQPKYDIKSYEQRLSEYGTSYIELIDKLEIAK